MVITGDIFEWTPPPGIRYDVIWLDIWPDIAAARLPEMAELHRRFAACLNQHNPKHWMDSWHREESERIHSRHALSASAQDAGGSAQEGVASRVNPRRNCLTGHF